MCDAQLATDFLDLGPKLRLFECKRNLLLGKPTLFQDMPSFLQDKKSCRIFYFSVVRYFGSGSENNKRERYLSVEEAQRLYESVCKGDTMLRYIVPMLILTGARKREVLDAKWEDFDLNRRIWRIPVSKSGKARHVPLSDGAITLLGSIPRKPKCDWAFANPDTCKPYASIFGTWNTARKRAGLSDVRLHDLRHSFASLLINSGRSLYEVQKILGHTQVKTTQRYAHLSQDTLLAAANAATEAVGAVMLPQAMVAPVSASPAALRA
jgi:integrase